MNRVMLISSDGHAGIPTHRYKEYTEQKNHAVIDEYLKSAEELSAQLIANRGGEVRDSREELAQSSNFMDPEGRLRDLEKNGVVGEVLFPGPAPSCAIPWSDYFGATGRRVRTPEARARATVGERAYNRFLAEFCQATPNRRAGLAILPLHDVAAAVAEIRWAAKAGLKGVVMPSFNYDLPEYCQDSYWEPVWAALSEANFSINFHGGIGLPDISPYSSMVPMEYLFFARRPIWHLILTKVFDRYPNLKVSITEASASWVPSTMRELDGVHAMQIAANKNPILMVDKTVADRKPSEYWNTNFFVGVSLLSTPEMMQRHEIGVGSMMFGVDYPHPEGTWGQAEGQNLSWLQSSFGVAGVSEAEARMILGENAARVYGFDTAALAPIVEKVGPTIEEVLQRSTQEQTEALIQDARKSGRALAAQYLTGGPQKQQTA